MSAHDHLVLDEPLSGLDAHGADTLRAEIDAWSTVSRVLLIAHGEARVQLPKMYIAAGSAHRTRRSNRTEHRRHLPRDDPIRSAGYTQ